jgi:hypothetical protein
MRASFLKWMVGSGLVGLLVAVGLFSISAVTTSHPQLDREFGYPLSQVMIVVWPSSFWLMATDGIEGTPRAYMFVLFSMAGNVVLYAILGSAAWCIRYLATAINK